ncbi:MAG: Stp1/IreP family PP2C-type Ser/Thr phosphatase [Eubacteriaceae bacterium]|nr:Stp1/IreP family PP2C-type Ser/Thr phosphatase [Eubacteriaceae bacterium]
MEVGFKTDKGVRRSNNEDACFVMKKDRFFVVADGVGGNNSGEIASRTAVSEITKFFQEQPLKKKADAEDIRKYFELCMARANLAVLQKSQKIPKNKGMATTVVTAYIDKNCAHITNIGDSRAYLLRNGKLNQITEDHTYVNTLLKAGIISEEEALNHENRNMITRAIGADSMVDVDVFDVTIQAGDMILLCTDGLYGEVPEQEIISIMESEETTNDICNSLVDSANLHGGRDNITMVVLRIMEEDIDE